MCLEAGHQYKELGPSAASPMIPDCNDDGYLPAGIHQATLAGGREGQGRDRRELGKKVDT